MSLLTESKSDVVQAEYIVSPNDLYPTIKISSALYDYSVNGGSMGVPIVLPLDQVVPADAYVITVVFLRVVSLEFTNSLRIDFPGLVVQAPFNVFPFESGTGPNAYESFGKVLQNTNSITMTFVDGEASQGLVIYRVLYVL